MIRIYPYKYTSQSAKALSKSLGVLIATPKQIARHSTFNTIINWGSSHRRFTDVRYVNNPTSVAIAADKVRAAEEFRAAGVSHPELTTDPSRAREFKRVLGRVLRCGSGGRGITYSTCYSVDAHDAQFSVDNIKYWSKYIPKSDEYRIHIFNGRIIDIQQKRKRKEVPNEEVNYQIRSYENGWVFCRDGVDCPQICKDNSLLAVSCLGLDFGAVDVGYNRSGESAWVYEVNTAPGLEGSTVDRYCEAFMDYIPELQNQVYQRRRAA